MEEFLEKLSAFGGLNKSLYSLLECLKVKEFMPDAFQTRLSSGGK